MFTYDPETGEFGEADESCVSDVQPDLRKRHRTILDYGDAYFVDQLIHQMGYDKVKNCKIDKQGAKHLGKVIDKENNVFFNKERRMFTYDPETGEFGEADESYVSDVQPDKRKRQRTILDYGDAYFVDQLIHQMGYDKVIDEMNYKNKDTLYAMVVYYVIFNAANCHANTWYEGALKVFFIQRLISHLRE